MVLRGQLRGRVGSRRDYFPEISSLKSEISNKHKGPRENLAGFFRFQGACRPPGNVVPPEAFPCSIRS